MGSTVTTWVAADLVARLVMVLPLPGALLNTPELVLAGELGTRTVFVLAGDLVTRTELAGDSFFTLGFVFSGDFATMFESSLVLAEGLVTRLV